MGEVDPFDQPLGEPVEGDYNVFDEEETKVTFVVANNNLYMRICQNITDHKSRWRKWKCKSLYI